jgi:hypothetical protein
MKEKKKNIFKDIEKEELKKAKAGNTKGLMGLKAKSHWHETIKLDIITRQVTSVIEIFSQKAFDITSPILQINEKNKANLRKGTKAAGQKRSELKEERKKLILSSAAKLKKNNPRFSNADIARILMKNEEIKVYKNSRSIQNILNSKK